MSQAWVASLKKGQEANWPICKAQNKWGGGSHKAGQVKSGDFIYIWLSGSGWLAKCLVTSDAVKPSISNPAPWKDGREYKYVFDIKVIEELDPPVLLGHKKRLQEVTRISQNKIQWFSDLDSGETDRLNSFFTSSEMRVPDAEKFEKAVSELSGELDKKVEGYRRTEQSYARARLLQGVAEPKCLLCNRAIDKSFLIAAHIKRRADCSDSERRDVDNNLMLACCFGCDDLFEHGYIGVDSKGMIKKSKNLHDRVAIDYIKKYVQEEVSVKDKQAKYFAWHMKNRYLS